MASPLPPEDFGRDLEQLGNLGAMRTAREDYVPRIQSAYGSIIQNAPDYQYFTAPLSNRGRTTATYGGKNNLVVAPDTPIRVVDNKTGEVIYSGTGYEGAQSAINAAKALSASGGSKANWDIQVTAPGSSKFESVSTERPDDMVGKIAGMALPIAVGFIPGLQGLGAVLASTAAGAGGAALSGNNILKGALMGGLSAAGGQYLSGPLKGVGLGANAARAVGTGLGATAGGLATGQSLKNALLSGAISGGTTYLGGELFGNRGTSGGEGGSTSNIGDSGVQLGDIVATARIPNFRGAAFTPSFADKAQLNSEATDRAISEGGVGGSGVELGGLDPDAITVTGRRIPNFSGAAFTPGFFDSASDFAVNPEGELPAEKETAPTDDEIIVKGTRAPVTGSSTAAVGGPDVDPEFGDDIEVTAKKTDATKTGTSLVPTNLLDQIVDEDVKKDLEEGRKDDAKKKLGVPDYLRLAGLAVGLGGKLFGGSGSGGSPGKYSSTGRLSPVFSAKLPTPGQGGAFTVGGLGGTAADRTLAARPVTDWYRYGMGQAMDIPAGADLSRATSPYAGYGPGTLGEETYRAISGIPQQPVGMSHGGDMGYSRGSSRESFAVEGPGTGRSDDIPAVLSDGEYVIDAETVALLGDGSSKAGAKKLDEMRVKVRKHKGKNLAKGKFSVNAKHPEAYMSGGRI